MRLAKDTFWFRIFKAKDLFYQIQRFVQQIDLLLGKVQISTKKGFKASSRCNTLNAIKRFVDTLDFNDLNLKMKTFLLLLKKTRKLTLDKRISLLMS